MPASEVRWLDADERRMWVALAGLLEVLPAALDAQLRADADLGSFEYMILARLSEEPGEVVAMSELRTFVAGSLSRLSHALTRLERQRLVERAPGASGGRSVDVRLLPAGRERIESAAPGHVAAVRRLLFDVLSPTQVRQLERISRTLLESSAPAVARAVDDAIARTPPPT